MSASAVRMYNLYVESQQEASTRSCGPSTYSLLSSYRDYRDAQNQAHSGRRRKINVMSPSMDADSCGDHWVKGTNQGGRGAPGVVIIRRMFLQFLFPRFFFVSSAFGKNGISVEISVTGGSKVHQPMNPEVD